VDYKVNMPHRGEVHAVKVLNDPKSIYAFLTGQTDHFLSSENFQRKFLHDLPKILWNFEKLEDLGDFVLLFPNPAHVSVGHITLEKAESNFDDIFDTPFSYPYKRKFMTALREAHNDAFLDLDLVPKEKKKGKEKAAEPNASNSPKNGKRSPGLKSSTTICKDSVAANKLKTASSGNKEGLSPQRNVNQAMGQFLRDKTFAGTM
jgi:hypothetical protein